MSNRSFEDIAADFEFLDDWEDRYRYLIELGKTLPPFPDSARTEANKVHGCVSQVWILPEVDNPGTEDAVLHLKADSDALIVRGLIAVLLSMVSGHKAKEILEMDMEGNMRRLGLEEHLTPQRANGLKSMMQRIREEARKAIAGV